MNADSPVKIRRADYDKFRAIAEARAIDIIDAVGVAAQLVEKTPTTKLDQAIRKYAKNRIRKITD